MNINDTLTRAFADLNIVGQIKNENLLNNLGVESNMKLYSQNKPKRRCNLKTSNDSFFKLIICNGNITSKDFFNLKEYQLNKRT